MKKKLFTSSAVCILVVITLLFACAPEKEDKEEGKEDIPISNEQKKAEDGKQKMKTVFYSLPSPAESASLLKKSGTTYNGNLMNPIENNSKYITTQSRAINLGIYLADLSYVALFEKQHISVQYMDVAKKMADGLGIPDAINETVIKKLKNNQNNKKVVMQIISESFLNANSYLNQEIASIVVIGAWIEGLYLATELSGHSVSENTILVEIIVDQGLSLENVLSLLDQNKDAEDIAPLLVDMTEINTIYEKMKPPVSQELFSELCEKVQSIRNEYTQ
jgi:D-arabinose 1-dehydrogenase-like Zn-dependent alcohol dehydrogenase